MIICFRFISNRKERVKIMASQPYSVLRSLAKELRLIYKTKNLNEVPIYVYLQDQFHYFRSTGEKICREKHEVEHLAKTYLCYLNSLRKQEELAVQYRGRGERSVESSANIVGLKLPKLYSEDVSQKPPEN